MAAKPPLFLHLCPNGTCLEIINFLRYNLTIWLYYILLPWLSVYNVCPSVGLTQSFAFVCAASFPTSAHHSVDEWCWLNVDSKMDFRCVVNYFVRCTIQFRHRVFVSTRISIVFALSISISTSSSSFPEVWLFAILSNSIEYGYGYQ